MLDKAPSTDKLICVPWDKEPDVPVKVTVPLAEGAFEAAERLNCSEVPGVRVTVDGETVTPDGNPAI